MCLVRKLGPLSINNSGLGDFVDYSVFLLLNVVNLPEPACGNWTGYKFNK